MISQTGIHKWSTASYLTFGQRVHFSLLVTILFVLGRYTKDQQSDPADIAAFLAILDENNVREKALWMICAFGQHETACLCSSVNAGGHARVGFENNRHHADGSIASNNVERVDALISALTQQNQTPCDRTTMRKLLGER